MLPLQLPIPARFQIIRPIGHGGMGAVYEALDVERNVHLALKTVLHRDPDALARFKHEFRALQDIHHPNLVALGELVGDESGAFFTMELVEGTDLVSWICGDTPHNPRSNGATQMDLRTLTIADTDRDMASMDTPPLSRSQERPSAMPRPMARFDEARLRDAFKQIVTGLAALHDAGKIHRDVKPSNVRVTPEGRVVLLDFGLVFEVDAAVAEDEEDNIVGTPAYMAPEQTLAEPVGPEADWYAVGAMIYLCLTGHLPFEGAAVAVLMAKHYQEPKAPSTFTADVPRDLEQLCMDLLQFDPAARPKRAEIMRRISSRSSRPPAMSKPAPPPPSMPMSAPFVGRVDEMAALRRAIEDVVDRKRAVSVVLHGESGMGKSSVARRFIESVKEDFDAVVLAGRCYEREAVPYKAFDEVIDTLSRRLARLPNEEALAILPSRVEALAQLFPALGRVPMIAEAVGVLDQDPHERRRGAFRALRELLRKMSAQQTLVIAIDDLQWTDTDSLALLQDLLRPPDAPPILLVVTMRGSEGATNPSAPPKLATQIPGDVRSIHIGRLAREDARELAIKLLQRDAGVGEAEAAAIAKEAGGHPLFIDELVRHAATRVGEATGGMRLDDALLARVSRLDLGARRVLEVACVLGAPVAQEVVATAAGLGMSDFTRAVALLRTTNLVRTRGGRVSDAIEPYHDRVREAVSGRLDPDAKRECHARLASALELAKVSDPEVLATHWAGAGEVARAARYAIISAEQAVQALAFERAARLYSRAIEFLPTNDARLRVLREQEGDALANAGECAKAALSFERAAVGANPEDALDLRRRASEQLLRAGELRRGMDATRDVLQAVGVTMPRTRLGVIVALLWVRFVLWVRGLGYVARDERDIPAADLTRIDVCWSASCTLNYADALTGALFQSRHLLLALRAGERMRVTRALSIEAGFVGAVGPRAWPQAARTLALAREASKGCKGAYAGAIVSVCEGIANILNFRFAPAVGLLEQAITTFREKCPGSDWEIATAQQFLFFALFFTCRFDVLRDAHEAALKDAVERGDRYASVMLRVGIPNRAWLVIGDPARARRELDAGTKDWPARPFQVVHFYAMLAGVYIALYDEDPHRAAELIQASRADVKRSMLLQLLGPRLDYAGLRGRVALAIAASDARAGKKPDLREVDECIRIFGRATQPLTAAGAQTLQASRAWLAGDREAAVRYLEELSGHESEDTWLAVHCARWILALVRGGPEGEAKARDVVRELEGRGVKTSRALIATQLPGFEALVPAPAGRLDPSLS